MTDIQKADSSTSKKPTRPADHKEIACDNLLEIGPKGVSKIQAHSLFSDGAFNTTVSKLNTDHGIYLAREFRPKKNKAGVKVRPMFYWIEDQQMAAQVIRLSNRLKQSRGAEPISLTQASELIANFPIEANTDSKEAEV